MHVTSLIDIWEEVRTFPHPPTYLIHLLTHLIHTLIHSFIHSFIQPSTHPPTHPKTGSS